MTNRTPTPTSDPTSTTPPLSRTERDMLALADALGVNRTPLTSGS
ncbi:hypothetical protein ACOQFV_24360 [Nocardiopsis changdeensis]|nr:MULTISPECIES: hypothetical protein [Nocardiopsis]